MKIFQRGKTVSLRGIITNPEKIRLLSVLYNPPASCHKDQRSECAVRPKLIFPLSRVGASKIMAAVDSWSSYPNHPTCPELNVSFP